MNKTNPDQLPRLYSMNTIGMTTFLGSLFAGGCLLAANYYALGMRQLGNLTLGISFVLFGLFIIIVSPQIPNSNTEQLSGQVVQLAVFVSTTQVIAMVIATHFLQGGMLTSFREMNGQYFSTLRGVGIGFAAYLGAVIALSLLINLFGLEGLIKAR